MIKIYHNPRCRKSREGLQILQECGEDFEIIDYLKINPSFDELKRVICIFLMKNSSFYQS